MYPTRVRIWLAIASIVAFGGVASAQWPITVWKAELDTTGDWFDEALWTSGVPTAQALPLADARGFVLRTFVAISIVFILPLHPLLLARLAPREAFCFPRLACPRGCEDRSAPLAQLVPELEVF